MDNYIIEPTEAATVHRIFDLYETGRYSMNAIAQKMLEEKRASANSMKWDASHIHVILNNEKYIGDVLIENGGILEDYLSDIQPILDKSDI